MLWGPEVFLTYLVDLKHRDGLRGALPVSHQQIQQTVTVKVCHCGACHPTKTSVRARHEVVYLHRKCLRSCDLTCAPPLRLGGVAHIQLSDLRAKALLPRHPTQTTHFRIIRNIIYLLIAFILYIFYVFLVEIVVFFIFIFKYFIVIFRFGNYLISTFYKKKYVMFI